MKLMRCPECEEVSTFTHYYTMSTAYAAPLVVDNDGDLQIDYDDAYEGETDADEDDEEECLCDKCNSQVSIDDIEIVEAENEVPAE